MVISSPIESGTETLDEQLLTPYLKRRQTPATTVLRVPLQLRLQEL